MTTRHRSLANSSKKPYSGVDAASALDLLDCDPKSLLWRGEWSERGDRREKSAAQLARELYKETVESKGPDVFDLLDLDAPSHSSASASLGQDEGSVAPDGRVGPPGVLWPGDTVFARYGPGGIFYRARIVRVYSSRGLSMADIEWLRPQAGSPGSRAEHVWSCGLDENLHRNGLQVSTDVRRQGASATAPAAASAFQMQGLIPLQPPSSRLAASVPTRAVPAATAGGDLLDLLDLHSPCESDLLSGGMPAAHVAAVEGFQQLPGPFIMSGSPLPAASAVSGAGWRGDCLLDAAQAVANGMAMAAPQAVWPDLEPSRGLTPATPLAFQSSSSAPCTQGTSAREEGFGFVSDMISQATDSSARGKI